MFHTVGLHEDKYSIKAQWIYFEAGHGKGSYDDLEGTTKRKAYEAVCQGKAIIQDAHEFYLWAITSLLLFSLKKEDIAWENWKNTMNLGVSTTGCY
jgi:hypothetical protein